MGVRLSSSLLAAIVTLLGVACDAAPGQLALTFEWVAPPPDGTVVYVTLEVQRRPELAVAGAVLSSLPSQALTVGAGGALRVPDVPGGDDLRLVAEVRLSPGPDQRVAYYGISDAFTMAADASGAISVAVPLRGPRTDGGNTVGLSFPGGGLFPAPDQLDEAIVTLTTARGVGVELANNPSFDAAVVLDALACPADEDGARVCVVEGWDLGEGAAAEAGVYRVYARFVDELGYPSPIVAAQTQVDERAPEVLLTVAQPAVARPGARMALTVTADEALQAPALEVTPAEAVGSVEAPVGEGATWSWLLTLAEDVPGGTEVTFAAHLADLAGNDAGLVPLTASGAQVFVAVDDQAPRLFIDELDIAGADLERLGPDGRWYLRGGDVITMVLRATDDHGLAGLTQASLAIYDFACVAGEDGLEVLWDCAVTIPPEDDYQGQSFLSATELDQAGNVGFLNGLAVEIDRDPPGALLDTLEFFRSDGEPAGDPPTFGPGANLEVLLKLTEHPAGTPTVTVAGASFASLELAEHEVGVAFVVKGPLPEGDHALVLHAHDRAGNAAEIPLTTVRYE